MAELLRARVREADMPDFAAKLAPLLGESACLLLEGGLGMGKTSFSRALIRHLSGNATIEVPSPTFTLVQTYDTNKGPLWHFDLYRLKDPEEIIELGWEDALGQAILLIEWPERLGYLRPRRALTLAFHAVPSLSESRDLILTDAA